MPEDRQLFTVSEVAAALGVSIRTVQRWIDTGTLAAVQLPSGRGRQRAVRIDRRDVDTLLSPLTPTGVAR